MGDVAATRSTLQRVATHVLARRRCEVTGRFGLRATPGGFGTPAFGDGHPEVVRVAGGLLVHEHDAGVSAVAIAGSTLAALAAVVGVDLEAPLSVGHDTPPVGDPAEPLVLDVPVTVVLADWLDLGWRALDQVTRSARGAAAVQLWPEHFDAGTSVQVGPAPDDRVNLGVSHGDQHHDEPYLYVGPWGPQRPGDAAFWNAPFGAVRSRSSIASVADAVTFFDEGIARCLSGEP